MLEICRCAGGRKKFRETPHWAKCMMARLVESNLIEVNERGHYRFPVEDPGAVKKMSAFFEPESLPKPHAPEAKIVGDNYFPARAGSDGPEAAKKWYVSPQMRELLEKSKKRR